MASTIDYQKIYDRYQTEGLPRQMSIVKFCEQNGVPYKQYEHWYKKCRGGRAVPVEIVVPEESGAEERIRSGNADISQAPSPAGVERRIRKMEIVFTDGMRLGRYEVMTVEDALGNRSEMFVPLDPSEKRRPNIETMPHTHAKPLFLSLLPFNIALN